MASIHPMSMNAEDYEAYIQKKEAEYDAMILRWHGHIANCEARISANERGVRENKKLLAFSKSELKEIERLKSNLRLNGGVH